MSAEIKKKYGDDPIPLAQQWMKDAGEVELNDPEAVCLATADSDGRPSNRMVLIKGLNEQGVKFHTNAHSHKGQDIAQNAHGAMCLYWKATRKQIRMEGVIEALSKAEADEYFASRPRNRQIGAWASQQSRPFDAWQDLEDSIAHYEDKFKNVDVIPRPEYWQGYRLVPELIEFWIASRDRLHTRFVYTKTNNKAWTAQWLFP